MSPPEHSSSGNKNDRLEAYLKQEQNDLQSEYKAILNGMKIEYGLKAMLPIIKKYYESLDLLHNLAFQLPIIDSGN